MAWLRPAPGIGFRELQNQIAIDIDMRGRIWLRARRLMLRTEIDVDSEPTWRVTIDGNRDGTAYIDMLRCGRKAGARNA